MHFWHDYTSIFPVSKVLKMPASSKNITHYTQKKKMHISKHTHWASANKAGCKQLGLLCCFMRKGWVAGSHRFAGVCEWCQRLEPIKAASGSKSRRLRRLLLLFLSRELSEKALSVRGSVKRVKRRRPSCEGGLRLPENMRLPLKWTSHS